MAGSMDWRAVQRYSTGVAGAEPLASVTRPLLLLLLLMACTSLAALCHYCNGSSIYVAVELSRLLSCSKALEMCYTSNLLFEYPAKR